MELLPDAQFRQQPHDRFRRLSADGEPIKGSLLVDVHHFGLAGGMVVAQDFQEPTVPSGAGIGDNDSVARVIFRPDPHQTHPHQSPLTSFPFGC